jgi:hypothetical protein
MAATFMKGKFKNLVLYIAKASREDPKFGATKLNKILYFSDFEAYGLWGNSITGATYIRLDRGPVAREMLPTLREMEDAREIDRETRSYFHLTQKVVIPLVEPDVAELVERELDLVDKVIGELQRFNANDVSVLSHLDAGWRLARDRDVIPYNSVYVSALGPKPVDR